MNVATVLKEKRHKIITIANRHGASNIRVFGSVVRNETDENSDIDFLVSAGSSTSSWFPAGLIEDLESLLGCKVEIVTEDALHWYIRDRILSEAVPL